FIIGFFSTFIPNLRNAVMAGMDAYVTGSPVDAAFALAATILTKNPFLGIVAGVSVRYIGGYVLGPIMFVWN
ncbi:MAG: hypothetical protein FWG63_01265, partial [Defluviitaleaceae bacterium]|nr:hypothetical protein [Defluviitaleaceae bacterium]